MTVKDLLAIKDIDIDVYDNYCEDLGIAYCGTQLTEEGKEKYKEILELEIELDLKNDIAVVIIDIPERTEKECNRLLKKACNMFNGMAGYCDEEYYNKYFK